MFAIRLKLGDNFVTFLTKLVSKVKTSICSTFNKILLFYCRKFSTVVVVVTI